MERGTVCFSNEAIDSLTSFATCVTDWLLNRRHCPQNWQQLVLAVREKISFAIQDMPAVEDVAKLLEGACKLFVECDMHFSEHFSDEL